MADIVNMPGVFRPDSEPDTEPVTVLKSALDDSLIEVVVIGRRIDGETAAYSSAADMDKVVGLLMRGVAWLSSARQGPDPQSNGGMCV